MIIRIPRNGRLAGDDAFTLSWYAWAIAEGHGTKFLIHPLSYIGAYPFSGYPVMTEFILAGFISLHLNIYISWILTGMSITFFSVISMYLLTKSLQVPEQYADLTILLYIISPIFVLYNLGSVSARGTFLAVLPFFVYCCLVIINHLNIKNFILASISMVLLLTTHRISFLFIPVFLLTVTIAILRWIIQSIDFTFDLNGFLNQYYRIIFLFLSLLIIPIGIISTHLFEIEPLLLGIPGIGNYQPGLITFMEIMGVQLANQGSSAVFAVVSVIIIVGRGSDRSEMSKSVYPTLVFFYTLFVFSLLFVTVAWYSGLLYIISLSFLGSYPLYLIVENRGEISKITLGLVSFFLMTYLIFILVIIPDYKPIDMSLLIHPQLLILILVPILLASNATIVIRKRPDQKLLLPLALLIILMISITSTIYYTDSLTIANDDEFPYNYISQEESNLAKELMKLNISGRVLSAHFDIGSRMMGLTGIPFYADDLGGSGLVSGYLNKTEVEQHAKLTPVTDWWEEAYIYSTSGYKGRISNIWYDIFGRSVLDPENIKIFRQEHTRYIILMNDLSITYGNTYFGSQLVRSIAIEGHADLIFRSTHLSLYQLPESLFT